MPVVRFPGSGPRSGPLSDPALDPAAQLRAVLEELARAREEWDAACVAVDQLTEGGYATPAELHAARSAVRTSYARWAEVLSQANALAEEARRAEPLDKASQRLFQETLDGLKGQFADGGPHYDLLCERVAGLHVRLKLMENAGHAYPPAEHHRTNQQLLGYINQLQKYTETMKSESISKEAQGVAEKILLIVEKSLSTSYPELWHTVMHDVRAALEQNAA